MKQIVECVPNFSEGNDLGIIRAIVAEITAIEGVKVLGVDPGKTTNRTVVTFVGGPNEVLEAAYSSIRKASELIDMRRHKGLHPRMGATDVCPFIPVANISMGEVVELARKLGERIGQELKIPVYCYGYAAFNSMRRNLATCRHGQYEGLPDKLNNPAWAPDYGPREFNPRSGAITVGARDYLVAYNVNLNTKSAHLANSIALDVREKGRIKREGGQPNGRIITNENGEPVYTPGLLKAVKGLGWYIEEYGKAQVSLNITDLYATPVHVAFDEVVRQAAMRNVHVTGSELVGLIPLKALTDAGKYYLQRQNISNTGYPDSELIKIAVKSLGLDDLKPFNPEKRIIEYAVNSPDQYNL